MPSSTAVGYGNSAKCKCAVALPQLGQGTFDGSGGDAEGVGNNIDADTDEGTPIATKALGQVCLESPRDIDLSPHNTAQAQLLKPLLRHIWTHCWCRQERGLGEISEVFYLPQ